MSDNIIQLNEAAIKGELKDLVKSSVEETLNALLEHEADELVNAERYERSVIAPAIMTVTLQQLPATSHSMFQSSRAFSLKQPSLSVTAVVRPRLRKP